MKINSSLGLLTCGLALATSFSWAQTTPTGTVNTTTYPQGAIAPDSSSTKASSRGQKRAMRQNRRSTGQDSQSNGATNNTSVQNARFQQSSASDGTATNNSNTTNYNSNNATNPTTGVGSNPNSINGSTQPSQTGSQSGSTSGGSQPSTSEVNSDAGAVEAVRGAKTSETPAVKSGSTVRNTSVGDFVSSSPNFTTLQNALQSSDLFETLKGSGPYTVFAPTNDAFKKLPTSVQAGLLDGSNKEALKQLLSYHVVTGTLTTTELTRQIKANNGKAQLKTLSGSTLTAKLDANGGVSITDEQGKTVRVDGSGNAQSNGMVYKIDGILMPKSGATFR